MRRHNFTVAKRSETLRFANKLGYAVRTMASRDELKFLIDQLPETRLEMAHRLLNHQINPPAPNPKFEQMQRPAQNYRRLVEQRFQETRKPGTIGSVVGGGFLGEHEGVSFGRQDFHYWDNKALVHQTLQFFDGQQIEIMERFSFSPDRTSLVCAWEISCGGHTVRHEDAFPIRAESL